MVPLSERGQWRESVVGQTIYHKNLRRVAYVFAESAGRAPAEAVVDIQADQRAASNPPTGEPATRVGSGWIAGTPRPAEGRTFLHSGGGLLWHVPEGIDVSFTGEGEWQLTIDVFRDMGLAFVAALTGIYILLVGQTKSFAIPGLVMLAIPLTVIGIMPGFWLLNRLSGGTVGGFANPIFFTATGMIGMIALAGIVTRNANILVDFIQLSLAEGRELKDAIVESCAVRLRPILLTAGTSLLASVPIVTDPIFSGLAWALIFGLLASTAFTLFVIPTAFWLLTSRRHTE
jgi:multidrug efflux pump subunit AcrB